MLYQICNGIVQLGGNTILQNINFEIKNTEKIAVVGRNGCGKSTLLKLIAGEIEMPAIDGTYIAAVGKPVIGYLKQMAFENEEETLENEVRKAFVQLLPIERELERLVIEMEENPSKAIIEKYSKLQSRFEDLGGYTYEKELEIVLKEFGFTEIDKKKSISQFSGGQRTKIAFAKLLLGKPDILLLDEPTNHLDIDTIRWLEGYLKDYKSAVIIVSHDRMFLDRIVDVVYEIEHATAVRYPGNYSEFVVRKRLNWEKQKKDYEFQQNEIKRLQTIVDKFKYKPTKAAMTRSKLKQIEHMVKIEAPANYDRKSFHADFTPHRESGVDALTVDHLQIGYDKVLCQVHFQQKKGQKIGIIGDNGVGKSTLLRTLIGQLKPLGGDYSFGIQTDIGYFEQQMAEYSSSKTILDDFWDEFPSYKEQEIRSALGAFLFSGEEVYKEINTLSGGQKVRLALARILMTKPNFLLLDEPTNHMDILGKESLEAMLKAYTGTVLFISHDRYFVKEAADALLIFTNEEVRYYPYGYDEYMEECEERKTSGSEPKAVEKIVIDQSKQKQEGKSKRTKGNQGKEEAKMQRRIEKLEVLIEEQEELIKELEEQTLDPDIQSDYVKLVELHERQNEESEKLKTYMEEWEELCDALLNIK